MSGNGGGDGNGGGSESGANSGPSADAGSSAAGSAPDSSAIDGPAGSEANASAAEAAEATESTLDPNDPVDPVDPLDPVDTVAPVQAVDPIDPIDPIEPVDPLERERPPGSRNPLGIEGDVKENLDIGTFDDDERAPEPPSTDRLNVEESDDSDPWDRLHYARRSACSGRANGAKRRVAHAHPCRS